VYPNSVRLVRIRLEAGEPGGTKALASVSELGFVFDNRNAQLDRLGVLLFRP
jgi:hypothetical protein